MGVQSHDSTAASPAVKPSVFSSCRWLQLINTSLSSTSTTQWWTLNECQQHTVKESSEPYKTEKAKIKSRVRILSWLKDRIVLVIKIWLMEQPSFSCSQKLCQTCEWTVEVELLEVKHIQFVKWNKMNFSLKITVGSRYPVLSCFYAPHVGLVRGCFQGRSKCTYWGCNSPKDSNKCNKNVRNQ